MLFLVFQIGKDAYSIHVSQVERVLPFVQCTQIPHAPIGLTGMFNYHGVMVPLIDLAELTLGRRSEDKMSTRIILARLGREPGDRRVIGLLAEQVMDTIRREKSDFTDPGMSLTRSPYLGPITTENDRVIQQIDVDRLLPADLEEQLFDRMAGSPR